MFDYLNDRYGKECLRLASFSKGEMKFGSVLVRGKKIIGRGWNRLSTKEEREILTHVDYSIHGEQAAVYDAIISGESMNNSRLYVLGYAKNHGNLSVRENKSFTCRKCPHTLIKYNIPVLIPTYIGWMKMSADEALESSRSHRGHWKNFLESIRYEQQNNKCKIQ